ncbi:MAG: hypothetical protein A2751_01560 [Candidatus Doudnabacteria bacterium RIFCSPHIGHO2_01_FULL_46_14]|uniref:histidine kinase n=1 Tax=Candidatus Doudnabacteria bacterium RIFCSPHIGHO2_01_FULL_46_14 TaxID=1817824 RepID=A0A1F5NJ47_9BACT|nr:MAG: hypothetical protein A2751_01560 [Candidatus Doudnabacteria bacterium RIFCSPHIGHO2_01_FULL_46_14]
MLLRNKIFTAMAMVSVIPLAILGLAAFYSINFFHEADVASIENNLLSQKEEEIQGLLDRIAGTLLLQVAYEQKSDIELSQQHFLLREILQEIPNIEEISFIALSGRETALLKRDAEDVLPADELLDQSLTEKFRVPAEGRDYLSEVRFTMVGPMVSLASPVRNRNNEIISVLTAEVNLSEIGQIIRRSRLGNSGYVYLADENGFLVAHSQPEKFSQKAVIAPDLQGVNRYQSFWQEPVVASRLDFPRLRLTLVAEWPAADADRIVNVVRNQIILVSLGVLLFTMLLSIFLANRVVRPIKILEQGTLRVAEGKFDQEIKIKTGDEIEELGTAFNKMTAGLKRLEELKEEFVFVAAHELRTPVTAIKGYLSMVMDGDAGPVSAEVKEMIGQVNVANARLVQLVEDLLAVARSEAGRLSIQVGKVKIDEQIREALKELLPLAKQKKIELVYNDDKALADVSADSARLREVLINLIGNAIKYTPGPGTVMISHEILSEEVITHIKDTGLGISPEAQKKLFEKFYRVQTAETANISGTGLGLFIVKEIVEKMNGRIWVKSTPAKGSVFSFALRRFL